MKKTASKETSGSTQSDSQKEPRKTPFTQADLDLHWNDYADKNGEDAYIKSMLQYCKPVLNEGYRVEIGVVSPEQERKLQEESSNLKRYLSECLQNDQISFDIQVRENNSSESLFTDKEKYNYLLNKNPDLGLLVREFNLRLD